ncbi:hypothetical protein [Dictyobacter arantiisoli]|uniref:Uncharacterized protein n=1 Tax=Dictyobacter arantiisoli TaxID=2014874 RepID=A0A5A5TER9_9CHLR|nr:hypothetical protein [Dictyobacter arantiisoli]GCF09573.1 hypothetical protein KDI_31370 [Dictyobacter arantiisoli]
MTQHNRRPLFREHALQHYMQRREEDVLPRIVSPPVFLIVWILFALVIAGGVISWLARVPVYVNGTGIVQSGEQRVNAQQSVVNVLIFVPVDASNHVRAGIPGKAQFSSSGQHYDGTITSIEPLVLSPEAIQTHYKLGCSVAQMVTEPSVAAHMRVLVPANDRLFSGTPLQAQLQTGTQRLLSLLPVFDGLMGGS